MVCIYVTVLLWLFDPPFPPSFYSKELNKEQSHECSNAGDIYVYFFFTRYYDSHCVCVFTEIADILATDVGEWNKVRR